MQATVFVIALFVLSALALQSAKNVKTFGTAIKNGHLTTTEQTIFEHSSPTGGVITEIWMTGGWKGFEDTRVRIYVDGETTPSIDYQLYLGHGIGWGDDSTFQGNEVIGKNAHGGGLYNTFRIPFGSSVRVTATLAFDAPNTFWFILRGLENLTVIMGDLELPKEARLKLYKNENVTLQPQQLTTLAQVNSGGALYMVTVQAESKDLNYLEACFRAYMDDATTPQFLSSGTEDFFLSAFYYNGGQFESSQAGLTHNERGTSNTRLSMYKMFWRDPVIFQKNLKFVWKNMEDGSCPSKWPPTASNIADQPRVKSPQVAPMTYTSYTWVYQWP